MKLQQPLLLRRFRVWAISEGISFLVLLFIAMPFKYLLGQELPVKIVGWAHGILFIGYCYYVVRCWRAFNWPTGFTILALIASLLPFGPFLIDRRVPSPPESKAGEAALASN
ncbi:MAG TPA: DUF3817 domain-containing protein [Opitutales bacterium]|nr:DUF3817 domain-containing protein [Opitutales bacterium]